MLTPEDFNKRHKNVTCDYSGEYVKRKPDSPFSPFIAVIVSQSRDKLKTFPVAVQNDIREMQPYITSFCKNVKKPSRSSAIVKDIPKHVKKMFTAIIPDDCKKYDSKFESIMIQLIIEVCTLYSIVDYAVGKEIYVKWECQTSFKSGEYRVCELSPQFMQLAEKWLTTARETCKFLYGK